MYSSPAWDNDGLAANGVVAEGRALRKPLSHVTHVRPHFIHGFHPFTVTAAHRNHDAIYGVLHFSVQVTLRFKILPPTYSEMIGWFSFLFGEWKNEPKLILVMGLLFAQEE